MIAYNSFMICKRELTPGERIFRVGLIDIRYFDRLRKVYSEDLGIYIRSTILNELENYHKIIFFDGSCNVDIDLYANVLEDVACCGIYNASSDVYLSPFNYQLINEIYAELSREYPLYISKLYSVNLDKTTELKQNKNHVTGLRQKFGVFNLLPQGVAVDDDNICRSVLR